jgi:phospholipid/cholesterol/gamma-HCH transport system permease protein
MNQSSAESRSAIGRFITSLGEVGLLGRDFLYWAFVAPFKGKRISGQAFYEQMVRAGVRSLPIVALVLVFIGMILALQMAEILRRFGVTQYVGNVVGVAIIRELGPLLTALVMAGYLGTSVAAELGTMKVNEEIMALEISGISPIRFLVVPRMAAAMVMIPCVTFIGDLIGIFGGLLIAHFVLHIDARLFIIKSYESLQLKDIWTSLVKCEVFAIVIALIACHQGLKTSGGPEGVGKTTTAADVYAIIFIVIADCVLTAIFYFII